MARRGRYKTRQRHLVDACLTANPDRYLTVDEVLASITDSGESIGRTTVYRSLEAMVGEGTAFKVAIPGGESSYRLADPAAAGQLVCLECGSVAPLDCHMARDLAGHVLEHHGFGIDPPRTILYGLCQVCLEAGDNG